MAAGRAVPAAGAIPAQVNRYSVTRPAVLIAAQNTASSRRVIRVP
jgi:hypothetical protein